MNSRCLARIRLRAGFLPSTKPEPLRREDKIVQAAVVAILTEAKSLASATGSDRSLPSENWEISIAVPTSRGRTASGRPEAAQYLAYPSAINASLAASRLHAHDLGLGLVAAPSP